MSWSQISRFGVQKKCQLKKCTLLLNVYSHERQYFLSWNCTLLPITVSRSWFSLLTCGPRKVHGTDTKWAVQNEDKTKTVQSVDKKRAVHDADKTRTAPGPGRSCIIHAADRTWAVPSPARISTIDTLHRTSAVSASVTRGSLQTRNMNVRPLCPLTWRNFSTSSLARTDTQKQLQSKDASVKTDSAEVNSGQTKLETDSTTDGSVEDGEKKLTLYQRFKKTYKEHGKILVAVHLVTSAVWFGTFYTVARCGVDVVALMEKLNFSDKIISPFRSGGLGDVAVAYLMYKLATPARYTVTIGGTNLAIRYLRKEGKIPQMPQEDRIRSLYKEGKEHIKKRSRIHMRRLRKKHGIKSRLGHAKDKH